MTKEKILKIEESEHTFKIICGTLMENLLSIGEYFEEEKIEFDKEETKVKKKLKIITNIFFKRFLWKKSKITLTVQI